MMPVSLWLLSAALGALSLAPEAAGGGAAAADPAARVLGERLRRQSEAHRLYQGGRFVEAALEFESLWEDFREAQDLFNAASSRATLGHYAHAVRYLEIFAATEGLGPQEAQEARAQVGELRRGLVAVRLTFTGAAGELEVIAEHVPGFASDLRPPLRFDARALAAARGEVSLDPGTWRLTAVASDGRRDAVEVVVERGVAAAVDFVFRAGQPPAGEGGVGEDPWRRFVIGAGISGGVVGAVGVGVLAGAGWGSAEVVGRPPELCEDLGDRLRCRRELARGLNGRAWGAALLGAGVGGVVGGLSARLPEPRRRVAWILEASAGGALAVGGVVGLTVGALRANRITSPTSVGDEPWRLADDRGPLRRAGGLHTASGALVGVGAGLVATAVVGLALERRGAARSVTVAPTLGGAALSGRF